jgi:RHS repeat-associated protein
MPRPDKPTLTGARSAVTLPEGAPFANYTYDGFGRQATNEATSGISHAYTYDSAGRLVKDSCYGYTLAYTYAANGARLSMAVTTSQGGSCNYSYTYDKNSRVISIAAICGTNSATVDYTYDNDGHVTEVTTPQANIFYSYDGGGRVTALQNLTPAGVVDDPTTQITGPDQLQHSVFSSFTGLNGPISYDTMWNVQGFQYQARVEPKNYLTGSVAYAFGSAASGSMPYAIESEAWTGSVNTTLDYTRDGGENLIQIRNDTLNNDVTSDQMTSSGITFKNGVQYDALGKMTQFRGLNATWLANGQLMAVGDESEIVYDVDDHRIEQNSGHSTEWFGYDGDSLVYHLLGDSSGSFAAFYVWGPTGPVMEIDSGSPGTQTYTFDPNGSLVAEIQGGPTSFATDGPYLYDAYGLLVSPYVSPLNYYCPFEYKGQAGYVSDQRSSVDIPGHTTTSLVNCQHRWYDPYSGRWLSRDPAGLEGGENAYEFCDGNPLSKTDPSGLWQIALDSVTANTNRLVAEAVENPEQAVKELVDSFEDVTSNRSKNIIKDGLRKIFTRNPIGKTRGFEHSLKHARELYGLGKNAALTAKQTAQWGRILDTVIRSNSVYKASVGGDQTIAFIGRFGGRAFVAHFFTQGGRPGEFATMFTVTADKAAELFEMAKNGLSGG